MSGQRVGSIRVSSFDQNPERQLEGVTVDRVFTDKASGKEPSARSSIGCSHLCARAIRWWCIAWIGWPVISMICAAWYSS